MGDKCDPYFTLDPSIGEIAKSLNYLRRKIDYVSKQEGPTGPRGFIGPQGATGPLGPTGPRGFVGPLEMELTASILENSNV